jgi:hypothetical protein
LLALVAQAEEPERAAAMAAEQPLAEVAAELQVPVPVSLQLALVQRLYHRHQAVRQRY